MKKKLLSAVLSAVMLLASVPMVHAEVQDIDVILNGEYVEFADQAPAMINDRTLVPIRAVLEKMNATVEWDEPTQTVNVKKDETTLSLTINEPAISVNGEKKAIDVAPQLINGRTMLPIRAVVEELGCTVGWDDYWQTVIIIDWDAYIEEFKTNAPAFYEYVSSVPAAVAGNYVSATEAKFAIEFAAKVPALEGTEAEEIKLNLALDIASNESSANEIAKSENVIKADLTSLQELLKKVEVINEENNIDLTKLDEIKLDVIVAGETIYLKTNLVKKLADVTGEENLKSLAIIFNSNTWMKITLSELAEMMGMSAENVEQFKLLLSQYDYDENDTALDVLFDVLKSMEYDLSTAESVDIAMDMYATMLGDEWFKFEKNDDGSYKVSMKLDKNAYIQLVKDLSSDMGLEMSVEEVAILEKMFDFNVSCDGVADAAGNVTSVADMEFAINVEEDGVYLSLKLDMDIKQDIKVGSAEEIALPEKSIDLINLLGQAGTIK